MMQSGIHALGDVPRRTAHEEVLHRLRQAILGGVLPPGTRLVLAELSTQLGVSRTPIREAIRDLAGEGLVDFDSYRSTIVHIPTLAEAREVYELRLTLEPIAVRRAVKEISDQDIAVAADLQRRMQETTDVGLWVQINRDFHAVLTEASDSPRLLSIIAGLRNAAAVQVAMSIRADPSQMAHACADHDLILDAYHRRDAEDAARLSEEHLHSTLQIIEDYERNRGDEPVPTGDLSSF